MIRDAIAKLEESDLPAYRDHLASYLHELGWRLMSRGQHAKAAEELQKSVEIFRELANEFPHIPRYDFLAAAYTSDLAKSLANSGQESTAEQLAIDLSPRTARDFVLRGNIYKELGMIEKAMANYDEAVKVGLEGRVPNIGRVGNFLDKLGKHEKAIVFYDHGVETQNTSPAVSRIHADRGASRARLKQYDKSLADFTSSIEIGGWDCEHHLSRMRPSMLRESPTDFQEEFLKLADRAIEITEGTGQSYITRSLVLFNLGRREEAKENLARGIELDPDFEIRDYLQPLLRELQDETKGEPGGVNPRVERRENTDSFFALEPSSNPDFKFFHSAAIR